jgi:proteasome accessory factor B/proteasome accessory factor C
MSDGRGTAADQLLRLLYLLPAAAERPLSLAEASEVLGVDPQVVLDDVADMTAREFYHPAGGAEDIRIEVESSRILVRSHDKFRRPVRLNPREALAAHLALRRRAAALEGAARDRVLDVAERIGSDLATLPPDEFAERFAVEESGESSGIRMGLSTAARDRRRCRIAYLRAGQDGPSDRALDPYAVLESRGNWFVVGYCGMRRDVRVFRIDRIIDLEVTDETFERPEDFDADDWIDAGRVFRADETESVTVRYSGLAAARARERGPTRSVDGGVEVTYDVADTGWIVRHVLQQGGEAEVIAPAHVRRSVARAADRIRRSDLPAG